MTKKQTALFLFVANLILSVALTTGLNYDTIRRYEVTKSILTGQPPVSARDVAAKEVLVGVNGNVHYWFGMGQSIFMLPGEIGATALAATIGPADEPARTEFKRYVVAAISFAPFNALAVTVAFLLLFEFGFTLWQSLLGASGLLFGTTFLHYVLTPQENNQILALILLGYYLHVLWLKSGRWRYLILGSGWLGILILVRITSLADIAAESLFVGLVLVWRKDWSWSKGRGRLFSFAASQAVAVAIFGLFDRLYQYLRFGSLFSNYYGVMKEQINEGVFTDKIFGPSVPTNWPFSSPFGTGTAGVLFSLEKSIFIYDLLLVMLILVVGLRRFRLDVAGQPHYRSAFLIAGLASLAIYLFNYDRIEFWGGDDSWGARYHSMSVQTLCLLAIPLTLEAAASFGKMTKALLQVLAGMAVVTQLASIFFVSLLEVYQTICENGAALRIWQRARNIAGYFTGQLRTVQQCTEIGTETLTPRPDFFPFNSSKFIPADTQLLAAVLWATVLIATLLAFGYLLYCTRPRSTTPIPTPQPERTATST